MNGPDNFAGRPRPNLFVVGAAKCGTTSLYHYLARHPDIFMSPVKEPDFFSDKLARPPDVAAYRELFSGVRGERVVGEASTSYFHDPESPQRLAAALGRDLKIVVSLRNPIDMMYAWWGDTRKNGFEPLDFEAALAAEDFRMTDPAFGARHQTHTEAGWRRLFAYRGRARYADRLARYFDVFGRARVRVLIFEEFFTDPQAEIGALYDFLGVDPGFVPDLAPHNPATAARFLWLQRLIRTRNPLRGLARGILPYGVRDRLYGLTYRYNVRPVRRPALPADLRARLWAGLRPEVAALEDLLERPLMSLWSPEGAEDSP